MINPQKVSRLVPVAEVAPDPGELQVAERSGVHLLHYSFDAAPGGEVVWTEWRPGKQQLWQAEIPPD